MTPGADGPLLKLRLNVLIQGITGRAGNQIGKSRSLFVFDTHKPHPLEQN